MRTWRNIIEAHEDEIREAMRTADVEAAGADARTLSGWTVDVVIDEDGNVEVTAPRSSGTMSEAEFDGTAKCIYSATVTNIGYLHKWRM